MKIVLKLNIIITLLISISGLAQQDKKAKFLKSEMVVVMNGKIYESSIVGKDCDLTIKYRQKKYYFDCTSTHNSKNLYQTFKIVEMKDGQIFAEFLPDVSKIKSKYLVKDSIDIKKKIEFIEEVILENGDKAQIIYKFSNE